ncbi:hypothetical protein KBI52_28960 [Microvirga sp. HBU67558]|uniref:hypothetical protein n=1 Tax=Microvirga TaxID=186650 RepID=UPI001B35E300|nr:MULTISPECIES: hypothetical protein [unclassified Microvirga]MBQ0824232.1 hypothetical protein [Microvirga sp. HBU67558]
MPPPTRKLALAAASLMVLAGCQSSGPMASATSPGVSVGEPGSASARVHAELDAEARALGNAQGVAAMAASMDKTGAASIPLLIGVNASNAAYQARSEARVKAAEEEDMQATYRKYGMNPDGTPSGRPGPGSAAQ